MDTHRLTKGDMMSAFSASTFIEIAVADMAERGIDHANIAAALVVAARSQAHMATTPDKRAHFIRVLADTLKAVET